jgi:hypothetical protein
LHEIAVLSRNGLAPVSLTRESLADLAHGAAFLGSGGGGDPYYNELIGVAALDAGATFTLLPLDQVADDALVAPCGWIGAPTVSLEKLPSGEEALVGLRRLEQLAGRPVTALMPIEIGGANGLAPLVAAARMGLPVIDADGMGRAFPESQMAIFNIAGLSACPAIVTSTSGATAVIETDDNHEHERLARALSIAMGGIAHMVEYPLSGADAKAHAIPGSFSAAMAIGAAVRCARAAGDDPFEALYAAVRATGLYVQAGELFDGKIVNLERDMRGGFSIGRARLETFDAAQTMDIEFQNENLIAWTDGVIRATSPDIISIVDRETTDTIPTERLKYGQRVKVIGASAPPQLRTDHALGFVGPAAFGYDEPYRTIEALNGWSA